MAVVARRLADLVASDPTASVMLLNATKSSIEKLVSYFKKMGILDKNSSDDEILSTLTTAFIFTTDVGMDHIKAYLEADETDVTPVQVS
jgi:hypothetical protein